MPLKVRVPLKVPTGDKYNFEATRVGSHLRLVASYQVCAFNASRHDITRGESVRLTGVVPIIPSDTSWNTKMDLTLFKHAGDCQSTLDVAGERVDQGHDDPHR